MLSNIVGAFVIIFSLLLAAVQASEGADQWVSNGPEGGTIYSIAIASTNGQIVYAATSNNGVFRSTDGGKSWSGNSGMLTGTDTASFTTSLAVDPTNSQTVYVGTWDGVLKSTDGGKSWSAVNSGITNKFVYSMAVDPTNSQVLYAGAWGDFFKSTNGGASWSKIDDGLGTPCVQSIAIDPNNSQVLYAGLNNNVVFKSTNGGVSWSATASGF